MCYGDDEKRVPSVGRWLNKPLTFSSVGKEQWDRVNLQKSSWLNR